MHTDISSWLKFIQLSSMAVLVSACGGGGGSDDALEEGANVFLPSETFVDRCEFPRSGVDPATGRAYEDVAGTELDEKNWLRSWSNELYLWYDEIQDRDPENYELLEYFDLLVTNERTDSGARKDNFHFYIATEDWVSQSQSGVSVGYGVQWSVIESRPPREVVVAYADTEGATGLPPRGARLLAVDGIDVESADDEVSIDTLNQGLFPSTEGEQHEFTLQYLDNSVETVVLTASAIAADPVQSVKVVEGDMGRRVGYMLFNDHIAPAERELKEAVEVLAAQNIDELVLDLRYNGGGFLAIASQLAYMIAGSVPTAGQTFEQMRFNDKYEGVNPVTGRALEPMPFFDTTLGLSSLTEGAQLPVLNLSRVFVLTGATTCSASESIINGLRGVDVEVVQIGGQTCGKPYGFYPTDNCGITYFTIQFQGVNAKGFGDYSDGFVPAGAGSAGVPGCEVADDFTRALGDPLESRFATALNYMASGACEVQGGAATALFEAPEGAGLSSAEGQVFKSAWLENRIIGR
ncbi:S41 family peptidase [Microbulbifer sp. 2201CG32-9]|uniref:S41 family peptidase n=1 Tax=Microbulbifer sp. 2201CG32-9 TaxID=3232309 RepID=UPI00345C389D